MLILIYVSNPNDVSKQNLNFKILGGVTTQHTKSADIARIILIKLIPWLMKPGGLMMHS